MLVMSKKKINSLTNKEQDDVGRIISTLLLLHYCDGNGLAHGIEAAVSGTNRIDEARNRLHIRSLRGDDSDERSPCVTIPIIARLLTKSRIRKHPHQLCR